MKQTKNWEHMMDKGPFFKQYEGLVKVVDDMFRKVKEEFSECVKCKLKCSDCCYALFDLTLIEAMYIKHHFDKRFKGEKRKMLLEAANQIDRQLYKLKRKAYKDLEAGKEEKDIVEEMASKKIRCPLLNNNDQCDLYDRRPITCRVYGIPTSIAGEGHTCGISGFSEGKAYPTVKLDVLQKKLYDLSSSFVASIRSRYSRMGEMLIPLSMAILTEFDEAYLGVTNPENKAENIQENKPPE